ncbi:hypothetical protein ACFPRL_03200 [Pseudoclavibacter helvolus]
MRCHSRRTTLPRWHRLGTVRGRCGWSAGGQRARREVASAGLPARLAR